VTTDPRVRIRVTRGSTRDEPYLYVVFVFFFVFFFRSSMSVVDARHEMGVGHVAGTVCIWCMASRRRWARVFGVWWVGKCCGQVW
jgi:hypothetical protein